MTYPRANQLFLVAGAILCLAGQARADEPDSKANGEATEHFTRGKRLFGNGDNKGALIEFQRAYDLSPSPLFLYHTGLVYAAMGKPLYAVDTLAKVLADPGNLSPADLASVRATKDEQESHIGELDVKVNVPATVEIDSLPAGEAPLQKPLRVAAGQHVVTAVAPGYLPLRQTVNLDGQGRADVSFELQPTEADLAHLTVHCPLIGAEVRVDDVLVGKTPLAAPVTLAPGKHVVELQRPGYMSAQRTLTLTEGAYSTVAFDPDEDADSGDPRGRLVLVPADGKVFVTIDNRSRGAYRKAIEVPAGPHTVKLDRSGFDSVERQVDVAAGSTLDLKVPWRATTEKREAELSVVRTYQHWAIAALITGALVAGGSTALAIWSNGQLSTAESKLADQQKVNCADKGTKDAISACTDLLASRQSDVDNYRDARLGGIIGAAAGVAIIGVGITLFIISPSAPSQDEPKDTSVAGSLVPVLSAGPNGASLLLRGRF